MASVRPMRAVLLPQAAPLPLVDSPSRSREGLGEGMSASEALVDKPSPNPSRKREGSLAVPLRKPAGNTLDGSWDRRLSRGLAQPDTTLDLHGHTLASAHSLLDQGLDRALARGDRMLLLVTGKPPRPESERPHARGAIRAAVTDWLAASRFADRIAAVRNAHPRHGGAGALYVVLRRR